MAEDTNYTQPQVSRPTDDDEESSFNLMEWVGLFLHNWYLLVVGLIVGLGLAYYQNRSWRPQYATEMKIMIEDNSSNQYSFMQGFGAGGGGYRSSNNQLLLLHSYNMMRQTVESLPFDVEYYTRGRFKTTPLYGREPISIQHDYLSKDAYNYEFVFEKLAGDSFLIRPNVEETTVAIRGHFDVPFEHSLMFATIHSNMSFAEGDKFLFRFRSTESLEEEFYSRLSVGWADEMSSVLSVSLVGTNPLRDVDFLNKLAEKYMENNLAKKNAEAIRTIDFIDEQLQQIAVDLSESEGKLRSYRRENNIIDVNSYMLSLIHI